MFWKQGGCLLLLLLRCDCLLALHQGGRQQNKRKEEEEGKNTLMAYWMDSLKAEANHPAKLLALLAEEGLSESRTAEITSPLLSPSFSYFSSTFSSKFIRAHPPESNRIESEHFPRQAIVKKGAEQSFSYSLTEIHSTIKSSIITTLKQFKIKIKAEQSMFKQLSKIALLSTFSIFHAYQTKEWVSPPLLKP